MYFRSQASFDVQTFDAFHLSSITCSNPSDAADKSPVRHRDQITLGILYSIPLLPFSFFPNVETVQLSIRIDPYRRR